MDQIPVVYLIREKGKGIRDHTSSQRDQQYIVIVNKVNVWLKYKTNENISNLKGILCHLFILTLEQIIVLSYYCTNNKPILKVSHVKTLQNLCKMRNK